MSYEINNYCFLGIQVGDIVNNLNLSIPIDAFSNGIFVVIDKKYEAFAQGNKEFSTNWECSSIDRMITEGYLDIYCPSSDGPIALFCRNLLMAAGIKESYYYSGWNNIIDSLLMDVKILPFNVIPIEINGMALKYGLVHIENSFLINLIKCFAENMQLTITSPLKDRNGMNPIIFPCIKTALHNLLRIHSSLNESGLNVDTCRHKAYSIEAWMHFLLDTFLESKGCYCDIRVASTYYGIVHKLGGMDPEVPYVIFGCLERYDENGWSDPRKSEAEIVTQAKDYLLGENSSGDWVKLTPQFGG